MKIRKIAIVASISLAFLAQPGQGQTRLTDLINYSLNHSHEIKKSELQCKEADYVRKEAIGQGLPQISGSAGYSVMTIPEIEIPQSIYQMVPEEYAPLLDQIAGIDHLNMPSVGIKVTQLIYSQAYWEGLKTTKKMQELYSILKTKSDEDVIAEVALGFYQAGSLMLQMKTVDQSLENLKEMYRISELSYRNDFIKESDLNRLKVTITNLEVTRTTLQNGLNVQLNYLKALSGMPSENDLVLDTTTLMKDFSTTANLPAFQVENVSSYQALMKQEELSGQQVKLSQATFFPTIAAYGQFNYSTYSTSSDFEKLSNYNTLGVSLSIPIFNSGVNYSKVKQAQLKEAQLQEDLKKTNDLLTIAYKNAQMDFQTANDLLKVQTDNRALAMKVYRQTSLQYQEGMASMADLLNVNSDFLQADNSFNQQILKCRTAEIKMLRSSGNLNLLVNQK